MPQAHRVFFEWSTDGVNYAPIGEGAPDADGSNWQLNGVVNSNGFLRARAVYPDASNQQSSMEFVRFVPLVPRRSFTIFDFDGDGKTDISIFRPSVGEWWYSRSSDGDVKAGQFGTSTDIITSGDFTGDGKADWAFFRPSTGFWFILRSEDGSFFSFPFGSNGDIPMPADFDGD